MAEPALDVIERELIGCAQSLFSFYTSDSEDQIALEHALMPEILEETLHCSSIGLAGDAYKVSVAILAASQTIAPLCPIADASTADWIGELANQLVGRLKNALLGYGHTGQLALPVTLSGTGLSLWHKTSSPATFFIRTPAGQIILRLEAEVDPDSLWTASESESSAEECSICFF